MTLIKFLITSNTFKIISNNKKILLDHCAFVILHAIHLLQTETTDQKGRKKKKERLEGNTSSAHVLSEIMGEKDETDYFLAT